MPAAALWNKDWRIRPAGKVFTELVSKTWKTNATGKTAADGSYQLRGFTGDYEVVIKYKCKEMKQQITLDNKGKSVVMKL